MLDQWKIIWCYWGIRTPWSRLLWFTFLRVNWGPTLLGSIFRRDVFLVLLLFFFFEQLLNAAIATAFWTIITITFVYFLFHPSLLSYGRLHNCWLFFQEGIMGESIIDGQNFGSNLRIPAYADIFTYRPLLYFRENRALWYIPLIADSWWLSYWIMRVVLALKFGTWCSKLWWEGVDVKEFVNIGLWLF